MELTLGGVQRGDVVRGAEASAREIVQDTRLDGSGNVADEELLKLSRCQ